MNFVPYTQFHDYLSRQPVDKEVKYFYSRTGRLSEAHMAAVRRINALNADLELRLWTLTDRRRSRTDPRSYKAVSDWFYAGICSAYSCHNPSLSFIILGYGDPNWTNTRTRSTITI